MLDCIVMKLVYKLEEKNVEKELYLRTFMIFLISLLIVSLYWSKQTLNLVFRLRVKENENGWCDVAYLNLQTLVIHVHLSTNMI